SSAPTVSPPALASAGGGRGLVRAGGRTLPAARLRYRTGNVASRGQISRRSPLWGIWCDGRKRAGARSRRGRVRGRRRARVRGPAEGSHGRGVVACGSFQGSEPGPGGAGGGVLTAALPSRAGADPFLVGDGW